MKYTTNVLAGLGLATLPLASLSIYHEIVKRKALESFAQLSAGNYEHALQQMAPEFDHFFSGTHALGGRRHSPVTMRRWFERLYRINQTLRFEIQDVSVSGVPWNTAIVIEWVDRALLADGNDTYINQGVHFIRMRWGRVVSLHAYLDTQLWQGACERMARAGVGEAVAAPIVD